MSDQATAISDFFGKDPIRGEEARINLVESHGAEALPLLLGSSLAASGSHQVKLRLQAVAASIGPDCASYLASIIREGTWSAKGAASACFGGFRGCRDISASLIDLLKEGDDFDVERMAVEAIGYSGDSGWCRDLIQYSKTGDWNLREERGISDYAFSKLAPYVLPTIVRFIGSANEHSIRGMTGNLREYLEIFQNNISNTWPGPIELAQWAAYELRPTSLDSLMAAWEENKAEEWRTLICKMLAEIRSLRSTRFLLSVVTEPNQSAGLRINASVALEELRDVRAARRVAEIIREGTSELGTLRGPFSVMRMLPIDWSGTEKIEKEILSLDSDFEAAAQLRYSLAMAEEPHVETALIDQLDSADSFARWTSALSLARLLGEQARPELANRFEDADDPIERCAMLAALIHAGDVAKLPMLHNSLQTADRFTNLRSVWRVAILSAFRNQPTFDPRAFELWWAASQLTNWPKNPVLCSNCTKAPMGSAGIKRDNTGWPSRMS